MTTLQIFDVEHGSCALLTCGNGMRMLIDCGHNAKMPWFPGDHLRRIGVRHLEMLVVTNYDQDHISGFPNLLDSVEIGAIARNASVPPEVIRQLKSEDGIVSTAMDRFIDVISNQFGPQGTAVVPAFPRVEWHLHRNAYPSFDDENNLSLVLRLRVGNINFVFPGDIEEDGWRHLFANDQELAASIQHTHVLIASHHGRSSGIFREMFETFKCNPELVVISDDYHQYDTQDTTDYYRSKCRGIENFRNHGRRHVLTTRRDGEITFCWGPAGCTVS